MLQRRRISQQILVGIAGAFEEDHRTSYENLVDRMVILFLHLLLQNLQVNIVDSIFLEEMDKLVDIGQYSSPVNDTYRDEDDLGE